jgi:hypothetical protein
MIKENKKDERLKALLPWFVPFYVSWTTVHVQVVFFGQLNNISIKDMCGIIVVYVSLEFAVSIQ